MPRALRNIALLASGLILGGCSVKAPPPQVWTLAGNRPAKTTALDPKGPALGVTHFSASTDVRTTELTWREADGHLIHQTTDRWSDYPDRMIEEMAMDALARAGRFSSVTAAPPREGLDEILTCRVIDFGEYDDAAGAMKARVVLRWKLTTPTGGVLASGEATGENDVPTKTTKAVVEAHAAAAEAAIASLLDQMPSDRPAGR